MAGIGLWLTKRERLSGDHEALVQGDRRLSYRELNRRVNRLAAWLLKAGLKHGGLQYGFFLFKWSTTSASTSALGKSVQAPG